MTTGQRLLCGGRVGYYTWTYRKIIENNYTDCGIFKFSVFRSCAQIYTYAGLNKYILKKRRIGGKDWKDVYFLQVFCATEPTLNLSLEDI